MKGPWGFLPISHLCLSLWTSLILSLQTAFSKGSQLTTGYKISPSLSLQKPQGRALIGLPGPGAPRWTTWLWPVGGLCKNIAVGRAMETPGAGDRGLPTPPSPVCRAAVPTMDPEHGVWGREAGGGLSGWVRPATKGGFASLPGDKGCWGLLSIFPLAFNLHHNPSV